MNTSTTSIVQHTTRVTSEQKRNDGGRALLLELFDDVHSDGRVGTLTAQIAVGGCISNLQFVETVKIKQSEIEFPPGPPVIKYL